MRKIYVVMGNFSDWEGGANWMVKGFVNKEKAEIFCLLCEEQLQMLEESKPRQPEYPRAADGGVGIFDKNGKKTDAFLEYEKKHQEYLNVDLEAWKKTLLDPKMETSDKERCSYTVEELEVVD